MRTGWDLPMRVRLNLDPEVADRIRCAAIWTGLPFRTIASKAVRLGLNKLLVGPSERPYRTIPHAMGLKPGFSYHDVEALATDGETTELDLQAAKRYGSPI